MNENIEKLLAKSTGNYNKSVEHSMFIKERAIEMLEKTYLSKKDIFYDKDEKKEFTDIIRISSLLHDIGKCIKDYQKKLQPNGQNPPKMEFLHNEIGWAFLEKYLKYDPNLKNYITDCVLYHHGIKRYKNEKPRVNTILNTVPDEDIETMKEYLVYFLGEEYLEENNLNPSIPKYKGENSIRLDENEDIKKMFFRTILVSADRMADTKEDNNINRKSPKYNLDNFIKNERLDNQIAIAKEEKKTMIVNAPAGFGKTLTGLLWNFNSDKKLIWVCPRNTVAESSYKNILSELKNIGADLKVELFLTSETKNSNYDHTTEFNSDIIVTNIDNFLAPNLNNSILSRLNYLANCDVVFDEYHELQSGEAYFSLFVDILKMRNMYTNSRTILLSATPINIHTLVDKELKNIKILPNLNEHYPPIHNNPYKINLLGKIDVDNLKINGSSLYIFNNITNAQVFKSKHKNLGLFHSKFHDNERSVIMGKIYDEYGKNSTRGTNKPPMCSTLIIQASLDISYNHLTESVMSHRTTLQRTGRVGRWGDSPEECSISILKPHNERESKTIENLYDKTLMEKWYEFLENKNPDKLTLTQFYEYYNEFNKNEIKLLDNHLNNVYDKSSHNLEKIDFVYTKNDKTKNTTIRSGCNKLRCSDSQIFFIVKDGSGKWTEPFTKTIMYGYDKDFNESKNTLNNMKKTMKILSKSGQYNYGNKKSIEKKVLDEFRRNAIENDKPYIDYSRTYTKEYGLIENNLLKSFK